MEGEGAGAPRADGAALRTTATVDSDGRRRRRARIVVARSMETSAIAAPSSDEGPAAPQHSAVRLDIGTWMIRWRNTADVWDPYILIKLLLRVW